MYIPGSMELLDVQSIIDIIHEYGFGLLISSDLEATHLPLMYKATEGANGYLYGHFAKSNPHWQQIEGQQVLVIFSGPHSYISPMWYATKPAVPTWNYVSIHCYGKVEFLSAEATAASMDELVSKYDPELKSRSDIMPNDFKHKLSQAVVGFRIAINEIQAKEKLGQHRNKADQAGVYKALGDSKHDFAQSLAKYMQKRNLGTGN